jgi:hypothetical protein
MTFLAVVMCILGIIGAILVLVAMGELDGFGLLLLGGYIGGNIFVGIKFGAPGVAIGNIVGIIGGILAIIHMVRDRSSSSSSSSYSSSSGSSFNAAAWNESRRNDPHTCGNCTKYSGARGECRLNGNSMSADDSCSNWC